MSSLAETVSELMPLYDTADPTTVRGRAEAAAGETVTAASLTNTNGVVGMMGISKTPLCEYLYEGEQPEYHFYGAPYLKKHGERVTAGDLFTGSILITSHRILVVNGTEKGDSVDVLAYDELVECKKDLSTFKNTYFTVSTETADYGIMEVDVQSEFEEAVTYVNDRMENPPDVDPEWLRVDRSPVQTSRESSESVADPDLKQRVEDKERAGWSVDEVDNREGYVVLYRAKRGGGVGRHGLVALFTGTWTLGLGNWLYEKGTKRQYREKIVLRADGTGDGDIEPTTSEAETETSTTSSDRLRELDQLHDEGVITDEEYNEKKRDILNDL